MTGRRTTGTRGRTTFFLLIYDISLIENKYWVYKLEYIIAGMIVNK